MVNYHNPVTIEREYSAYAFSTEHRWQLCHSTPIYLSTLQQRRSWISGTLWMAYTCESPCLAVLASTRLYSTIIEPWIHNPTSWEFLSTLDFEWDFIRGKHPYRRTIWVCSLLCGFLNAHSTTKDCYWSIPAIGLLHCTPVYVFRHDSQHDQLRCCKNKLSCKSHVPLLARYTVWSIPFQGLDYFWTRERLL